MNILIFVTLVISRRGHICLLTLILSIPKFAYSNFLEYKERLLGSSFTLEDFRRYLKPLASCKTRKSIIRIFIIHMYFWNENVKKSKMTWQTQHFLMMKSWSFWYLNVLGIYITSYCTSAFLQNFCKNFCISVPYFYLENWVHYIHE